MGQFRVQRRSIHKDGLRRSVIEKLKSSDHANFFQALYRPGPAFIGILFLCAGIIKITHIPK